MRWTKTKGSEAAEAVLQAIARTQSVEQAKDVARLPEIVDRHSHIPVVLVVCGTLLGGLWRTVFSTPGLAGSPFLCLERGRSRM